MPDHYQHDQFNFGIGLLIIVLLMVGISILTKNYTIWIIGILSYLFASAFLSPDLDIKSKPVTRWRMLSFIWYAYRKIFKHRGVSHKPLLGTITRIIYLFAVFSPIYIIYLLIPNLPSLGTFVTENWIYLVVVYMAIMIADIYHIVLDYHNRIEKLIEHAK